VAASHENVGVAAANEGASDPRWSEDGEGEGVLHVGELEIRPEEGLALATGQALMLSVREFSLLVALARRAGTIVSREDLYDAVWGGPMRSGDRSVDVYVSKLRSKLEQALPDRRFIHTHAGFGYRFHPQPSRELSRDLHNGSALG
jgi:DNA-binding response OmpR family regulator